MKAFFVTATDTDAGKTFVCAGLLHYWSNMGYKTLAFKPVASGCQPGDDGLRNDDALQLIAASNISLDYETINPYAFAPAIAPHIAAQQAGIKIDLDKITSAIAQYQQKADYVLVEGVGGWLVPLNERQSLADLAKLLAFPVILVVRMRLGCINQALLTAQAIEQSGLTIAGWVANMMHNDNEPAMLYQRDNIDALNCRINAPLLGVLPHISAVQLSEEQAFGAIGLKL